MGLCPVVQEILTHGEKKKTSYTFSKQVLKQSSTYITPVFKSGKLIPSEFHRQNRIIETPFNLISCSPERDSDASLKNKL